MRKWLFEFLFKKIIPFKWIDGQKTSISRWAAFISALLLSGVELFPEYVPFITQGQALLATVLSLLGIELGKVHKGDKNEG